MPCRWRNIRRMRLMAVGLIAARLLVGTTLADAALLEIPVKTIDGKETSLAAYRGKVLLVVNVASECGFTRQYQPLEAVYRKHKDRGLVVLGFPCNDFGGQEPGGNTQILNFCQTRFDVSFPMFDKLKVKPSPEQHPLYAALTGKEAAFPGAVEWNFTKFLIGKDGKVLARFPSAEEPDGAKLTAAIEKALAAEAKP